jgi:low affinity Fe/Cu permease
MTRGHSSLFERFSQYTTKATGSTPAFLIALGLVLVWGISGPAFHYSEGWQMVINTGTTIITFLMVFLIQKAQNKDSMAIQLKLDELIAAHKLASNRLVNVESMSEEDLKTLQKYYADLSIAIKSEENLRQSHSIDEGKVLREIRNEVKDQIAHERKPKKSNVNNKRNKNPNNPT